MNETIFVKFLQIILSLASNFIRSENRNEKFHIRIIYIFKKKICFVFVYHNVSHVVKNTVILKIVLIKILNKLIKVARSSIN